MHNYCMKLHLGLFPSVYYKNGKKFIFINDKEIELIKTEMPF